MTEQLRDVEKVSCAAAQIENALGTRHVEFKLGEFGVCLTLIQRSRSNISASPRRVSATAYRWRICSKPAGSNVSMTRCVCNWKRFGRSSLSVCFLALATLLPSTSFVFYGEVAQLTPCSEAQHFN